MCTSGVKQNSQIRVHIHLKLDKKAKHIHWRKQHLQQMMLEKLSIHSMAPCLTPCTKISSKWIRGLNLKAVMLKAREESKGSALQERSVEKDSWKGLHLPKN